MFQAHPQDLEQSFYGLSGQPAATGMPAIAMQVNRLKQDALSSAKTPEAAKLALGAINGVVDQSMWRMARHADSQQTVYDNDLDQQRVDQSKLIIARNYNDDEAFIVNSHVADQSEQHIAIRGARSADGTITAAQAIAAADAARLSTMSEMIAARIGGALTQNDLPYAGKLIAKYGGELLPADRALVDQQYHAVQFQSQVHSETERVSAVAQTPPSGSSTSGGGYRNADRVLHRGDDIAGDAGMKVVDDNAAAGQHVAQPTSKPTIAPARRQDPINTPEAQRITDSTDLSLELPDPSKQGFRRLPAPDQESFYYGYNPSGRPYDPKRQYARPETLSVIVDLAQKWGLSDNRRIGIGDVNESDGGNFPGNPHNSHHSGLDFDMRAMRKDGQEGRVAYGQANYDRDATLIQMLKESGRVKKILFNDPMAIKQFKGFVQPYKGHDDHLHVTVKQDKTSSAN
jgi:hypothetical protein